MTPRGRRRPPRWRTRRGSGGPGPRRSRGRRPRSADLELQEDDTRLVLLDVDHTGCVDGQLDGGVALLEGDLLLGRGVHVQLAGAVGVDFQDDRFARGDPDPLAVRLDLVTLDLDLDGVARVVTGIVTGVVGGGGLRGLRVFGLARGGSRDRRGTLVGFRTVGGVTAAGGGVAATGQREYDDG